jgi:NTP pyrophosphatase (non-canonical NTP hydrolase)
MGVSMKLDKLYALTQGLNRRFPNGNEPFQMMTRLLEECGELAKTVNHFEGTGIKRQKYGEPDRSKMAKEIMDLLRCGLQVALYYRLESELESQINESFEKMRAEGLTEDSV